MIRDYCGSTLLSTANYNTIQNAKTLKQIIKSHRINTMTFLLYQIFFFKTNIPLNIRNKKAIIGA